MRILVLLVLLMMSLIIQVTPSKGQDTPAGRSDREKIVVRFVELLFSKSEITDAARYIQNGTVTPAVLYEKAQNERGAGPGTDVKIGEYTDSPLEDGTYDAAFFLYFDGRKPNAPVHLTLRSINGEWKIVIPKYHKYEPSGFLNTLSSIYILPTVNYSDPESVISGFVGYVNVMDFKRAKTCLLSVNESLVGNYYPVESQSLTFELISPPVIREKTADRITYEVTALISGRRVTNQLVLVKSGTKWLIAPSSLSQHSQYSAGRFLNDICIDLADLTAWKVARATKSMLSNTKQIAAAVIMYLVDYDDTFSLTDATLVAKLQPYLKNTVIFTSPLDSAKKVSLHFNSKLQGRLRKSMRSPESIIMLYDGTAGTPLFRYGGRAIIATADGAARLVTREEYQKYRWSP